MVQVISSMVDIRNSCYAALLAAFLCPQKHCKTLIFRGAHKLPEPAKEIVRRHAEFLESAQSFLLSGDNDRFMNHSESPSIRDEGLKMYANEFIPVGAELTCDYRHVRILDFVPV